MIFGLKTLCEFTFLHRLLLTLKKFYVLLCQGMTILLDYVTSNSKVGK